MPAMAFLCEQCGEKELFFNDLSRTKVFVDNVGPTCLTPQCGRELSPLLSLKIEGIRDEPDLIYDNKHGWMRR